MTEMSALRNSFDFVVVGGGTAGCVVASRLSEIANFSVLLLEAGDYDGGSFASVIETPASFASLCHTEVDWDYQTVPQTNACLGLNGRKSPWPRGKVIGGSSAMNALQWVRGSPADYDHWAYDLGCDGWSYKDVLPYFKKCEGSRVPSLNPSFHNSEGPVIVTRVPDELVNPISRCFMKSCEELGIPPNDDTNGEAQLGCQVPMTTTKLNGRRSFSSVYLELAENRSNLTVITSAHVTRLKLNSLNIVTSVEYRRTSPDGKSEEVSVEVKKEVILCAGVIGSPQILMLSGIGPRDHLKSVGIPCHVDLRNVGENLMDHIHCPLEYSTDVQTLNASIFRSEESQRRFREEGKGPLTHCGIDIIMFHQTDMDSCGRPDGQVHIHAAGMGEQKVQPQPNYNGYASEFDRTDFTTWKPNQFMIYSILLHPKSRGNIRLKSKDPFDHPIIDPKYLSNPEDVQNLIAILRTTLKIVDTETFQRVRGEVRVHEKCPHKFGSDAYLEWMIRHFTLSVHHPAGTCRMGAKKDRRSVVCPDLKVKEVQNLRIADCSIMPTLSSGNTQAPAYMIGEKAADIVKEKYCTDCSVLNSKL